MPVQHIQVDASTLKARSRVILTEEEARILHGEHSRNCIDVTISDGDKLKQTVTNQTEQAETVQPLLELFQTDQVSNQSKKDDCLKSSEVNTPQEFQSWNSDFIPNLKVKGIQRMLNKDSMVSFSTLTPQLLQVLKANGLTGIRTKHILYMLPKSENTPNASENTHTTNGIIMEETQNTQETHMLGATFQTPSAFGFDLGNMGLSDRALTSEHFIDPTSNIASDNNTNHLLINSINQTQHGVITEELPQQQTTHVTPQFQNEVSFQLNVQQQTPGNSS